MMDTDDDLEAIRILLERANRELAVLVAVAQAEQEADRAGEEIVATRRVTDIVSWYEERSQYHNEINRILGNLVDDGLVDRECPGAGRSADNRPSEQGRETLARTGLLEIVGRLAAETRPTIPSGG